MRRAFLTCVLAFLLLTPTTAQQTGLTDAQIKSAAVEVPQLVELLGLKPGMTIADVGAGFGAWTARFSAAVGPTGRVYATDIGVPQLAALRETVKRDGLANVVVLEGAVNSTNLPNGCCDALLMRDAYHHLTEPAAIAKSFAAALKPSGRLAVIDFPPRPNSELPEGVPANRGGHGVPPEIVQAEVGAVLTHVRTVMDWSPQSQRGSLFLVLFQKP